MRLPLAVVSLLLALTVSRFWPLWQRSRCRCRPGMECWPSLEQWGHLNASVDGQLSRLLPPGSVCHESNRQPAACDQFHANFHNSTWRALHPGGLQIVPWEHWREKQQSCHASPTGHITQCDQGRVPHYSVSVQSIAHVQEAVRFAQTHRLRLVVRNSGHDMAGRSSAPGSLQIYTAGLGGIQHTDSFQPEVPLGASPPPQGPAITVGAGVLTGEVYSAAAREEFTVVGGSCSTVGIAGGWMQGGGYGILSPSHGLGVDQVLEFGMVTAQGHYVTANRYQNQDLFWAMRGSGGAALGVLTSVTFRVFPDASLRVSKLSAHRMQGSDSVFWDAVRDALAALPPWIEIGSSVQTFVMPAFPMGGAFISMELYQINQTDSSPTAGLHPLTERLETLGLQVQHTTDQFDRLSEYLAVPKGLDQAGVGIMAASRLVSSAFLTSSTGPSRMADTLSQLHYAPGDILSLDGYLGGQVGRKTEAGDDDALHPDFRSALLSLTLGRALPVAPDWEAYQAVEDEVRERQLPLLESIECEQRGGYLGIAFPYERSAAHTFWGSKYPRLLEIKRRWDPEDLFMTRLGPGSERWDDEAMCRTGGWRNVLSPWL